MSDKAREIIATNSINERIKYLKQCDEMESAGEVSDGYHTFNELYHHRAMLFASVCQMLPPELCWKSRLHDDATMYDGMFIVGVSTPNGQATYHYDLEPYWDIFNVKEIVKAPKYDGHTPEDAIDRIYYLTKGYKLAADCQVSEKED